MLKLHKSAILIWLLVNIISFVVSTDPSVSYVLKTRDENSFRTKRRVSEDAELIKDSKSIINRFTVTSNIKYRYATTVVSNNVSNPADTAKEIAFTVTLPNAAFVSGFLMQIKGKVYEAYVKEKEEARREYTQAVNNGETAGHVELVSARDSDVFTVSVNVEPQSKVTFNLTYEQLLERKLGLYENVVHIDPGQIVKSMDVEINIDESSNITVLQVPDLKTSNEIDSVDTQNKLATIEQSGKTAKVTWSPDIEQQQQLSSSGIKGQFIVRYDVDRVSNPNQILIDEGYFVHFYAPSDLKPLNKHILFALDVSGSMSGRKIEQLREALVQILSDIGEGDYFSLILFSDAVQLWTLNGPVGYTGAWYKSSNDIEINERFIIPVTTENIAKAKAFANNLSDTGGTNIIAALRKSIQIAQWGQKGYAKNAKPLIIFLTDGEPNVEMSNTEEIVKTVKNLNVDNYPLFSLAFGDGAHYDFLRKLSLLNSGFSRHIYIASDTYLQLSNFYKQVASPLLSNVTFEYVAGQVADGTLTKSVFSNLFKGSELVVAGKLAEGVKTLSGNLTAAQSSDAVIFPTGIPPCIIVNPDPTTTNRTKGHLEKLWAYLYVKQLIDKDLLSNEQNSMHKQKALKLSLEYSFVTPLTSLVVRKPNETSNVANVHKPQSSEDRPSGMNWHLPSRSYEPAYFSNPRKTPLLLSPVGSPRVPLVSDVSTRSDSVIEEADTATVDKSNNSSTLLNITDIQWLRNSTEIAFPPSNNKYLIGSSNLPNKGFQSCTLPKTNKLTSCRHLVHCVIPEIVSKFEDFVPYGKQCVINARFVGICCPPEYSTNAVGVQN